jgi:hypothetical protein
MFPRVVPYFGRSIVPREESLPVGKDGAFEAMPVDLLLLAHVE